MSSELAILKEFPLKISIEVAWTDMDAYAHVNNSVYFKYFDQGRMKYFDAIDFQTLFPNLNIAAVLNMANCHFITQLKYPDIITLGTRVKELTIEKLTMEQFITSPKTGLVAFGLSELTLFDFETQKSINISEELIIAIQRLEGKQLFK